MNEKTLGAAHNIAAKLRARNERFQDGHGNYLYYGGADSNLDCDAADMIEALSGAVAHHAERPLVEAIEDCESAIAGLTPLNATAYIAGRLKTMRATLRAGSLGRVE